MTSPVKRAPKKAAPRGKWSEATLLTSEKSVLVHADLVKLLASPEAWNCLDESDKQEILALLPADIHPETELQPHSQEQKLLPLPASFLRYSNNWRDGLRQFQLDLENGRYDPEWLRQAEKARKQRESGDFDTFKEREFEQFWGQKQNFNKRLPAGDSAKIKLSELVEHGVIQLGDVWRFRFGFGKGENNIKIDKEVRIDRIEGSNLSFTIPTGGRTFLSSAHPGAQKVESSPIESDIKVEVTATTPKEVLTDVAKVSPDTEEPPVGHSITQELPAPSLPKILESDAEEPAEDLRSSLNGPTVTDSTAEEVDDTVDAIMPQEAKKTATAADASLGGDQETGAFQVIIVNQNDSLKPAYESLKRPTPQPESEPPAKRKRGRPRKIQSVPELGTEIVPDPDEKEVASPEVDTPANPGISVEIVKSPYYSSNSASSEAMRSNTQTKDPEQSTETSPPTDIEMRDADGPTTRISLPLAGSFTDPELPEKSVETTVQAGELNQSEKTTATTNTNSYEPERIEEQEEPASSPLSPARSMTNPQSTQHQEEPEQTTDTAEQQPQPDAESNEAAPQAEAEQLEVTITIPNIKTPNPVITHILKLDGRKPDGRTGNSWKEFRCYRNNQDIGSLWELREAWYLKQK
ncbi:unnamed protein product [Penicillium pancosmium]